MKTLAISFVAVAVAFSAGQASAQTKSSRSQQSNGSNYNITTTVPTPATAAYPVYSGWQPGAATADESWAYGRAAVINALGQANLNSAIAATYWETARQMHADNWNHEVRIKWQVRDDYQARYAAEHPTLSAAQQREITKQRDPKRLSANELTANGTIRWPSALKGDNFADMRTRLDELFAERARGFATGSSELTREVDAVAAEMTNVLEKGNLDIPVMERVAAKNFLGGLRVEARIGAAGMEGQVAVK